MKRKTIRKVKEVEEEKKEALLPAPTLAEQSQPDMEISQEKSQEVLLMRTVTWLRDSHSLFDYESRQIQKRNLKIEHSCNFIRTKDEVKTVSETDTGGDDPETKPLFSLIKDKDGKYYIDVIRKENTDKLWLVVRALNCQNQRLNYEMRQNDIVKLGRVLFKVKEIRSQRNEKDSNRYIMFEDDMKEVSSILVENEELPDSGDSSSSPICRVCWGAECSQENPLINACCKCIGGMKYIHLNCLKCWVKSKSKVTTPEKKLDCLESFVWSSFKCEICKTKYPCTLKHNDSYYNIFDITRPSGPYCILESISVDENGSKMIFVIKPNADECEYLIGRGHDSDIRISDISVSRCHAKIICKDGKFMLKDNGSKFGTLVQINEKWPIITNHTCAIQSGRTVVTYLLKPISAFKQCSLAKKTIPFQSSIQEKLQLSNHIGFKSQAIIGADQLNLPREGNILPSLERFMQEAPFQENENMIIALPHVPEEILKQDMERDQDSMNQDDNNL